MKSILGRMGRSGKRAWLMVVLGLSVAGQVARWVWPRLLLLLPQLFFVIRCNRVIWEAHQSEVDAAWNRVADANVDLAAAIALWQFETDRLNGLSAKGAAVLAVDAIVVAGIATQVGSNGASRYMCIGAMVYLLSALTAGFLVQRPRQRRVAMPEHVINGIAAKKMVAASIANVREGIVMQNLVYIGFRDTVASLTLFIAALVVSFVR